MNSPVHRIKQKMSYHRAIRYNNPSHKWRNLKITFFIQCRVGAGCHMRLGDGCPSVKVGRSTRTAVWWIFSFDLVMHVSLLKLLI